MDLGIQGKNAFLAAATDGLGLASAQALAAEGVNVAILGRRRERAEALAEQIAAEFGVRALGLGADLLDRPSLLEAVEAGREELGEVDILLLNGPGPRPGGSESIDPSEVVLAAETMIAPQVALTREFLPGMKERGWGRIVAAGSFTMDRASTWLSLSAIGRSGLARYLQALSVEVAGAGVTVNIVQPGIIATSRIDALDEAAAKEKGIPQAEVRRSREAEIPMKRLGDPAEFGAAVAFLCSDPARYITGQSLLVGGGLYIAD